MSSASGLSIRLTAFGHSHISTTYNCSKRTSFVYLDARNGYTIITFIYLSVCLLVRPTTVCLSVCLSACRSLFYSSSIVHQLCISRHQKVSQEIPPLSPACTMESRPYAVCIIV